MIKKNLKLPVVILHEMEDTQYKIAGELVSLNESNNTCSVRFKNNRVENNIPLDIVYINESLIDTVKKYGRKLTTWIIRKVKGIFLFANPEGELDENSTSHPLNLVAMQSNPSFVKFYPNENLVELAQESGINVRIPSEEDEDYVDTEEINSINRFWNRVMKQAGTTDKTIEESIKYVYENYYHPLIKDSKKLNEAGIPSQYPTQDGLGRRNLNGKFVHTEELKGLIRTSIEGQLKTTYSQAIKSLEKDPTFYNEKDAERAKNPKYIAAKKAMLKKFRKTESESNNKTKPLLIWGAPGIGKTEIVRKSVYDFRNHPTTPLLLSMQEVKCTGLDADSFRLPKESDKEEDARQEIASTDGVFHNAALAWLPMYTPSDSAYNERMEKRFETCCHLTSDHKALIDEETGSQMQGGVLFFDEIIRATKAGFKVLMDVCDRKLQEKRLARSWAIVCASNRFSDDPTQDGQDDLLESSPILQRFTHVTYIPTKAEWLVWARSVDDESGLANIEPEIVSFVEAMPDSVWYRTLDNGGYEEELKVAKGIDPTVNPDNIGIAGTGVTYDIMQAVEQLEADGANPLRKSFSNWNGRTWDEISYEYRQAIMGLLDETIVGDEYWTYPEVCLRSYIDYEYNGAHPEYLKEALDQVPDDYWKNWCAQWFKHDPHEYKAAVSKHLTPEQKLDVLHSVLISIVKEKTGSGDSGIDETEPVKKMKEFYNWRKDFSDSNIIRSIYDTGYLPKDQQAKDNAAPLDGGFSWKNDTGIVTEVNKYILQNYPNGKHQATEDYLEYAEFVNEVGDELQKKLQMFGVKKMTSDLSQKFDKLVEETIFGTEKVKNPSKADIDEIFILKTGSEKYGSVNLLNSGENKSMQPLILKCIYYLYNKFNFYKYMINYTKYRIKIEFTRDTFNLLNAATIKNGKGNFVDDYRPELQKILGLTDESVNTAMSKTRIIYNNIAGTGKDSMNLSNNDMLSNLIFLNIFSLLQYMMICANNQQRNVNFNGRVEN